MAMQATEPYTNLDYGYKPMTWDWMTIGVMVDPSYLLQSWAGAYELELHRLNPDKQARLNLTANELQEYFESLLAIRVMEINRRGLPYKDSHPLYIPDFLQTAMRCLGVYEDRDMGRRFVPVYDRKINLKAMLDISNRLRFFEGDGLHIHQGGIPGGSAGDEHVMQIVAIDDVLWTANKDSNDLHVALAGLMGLQLQEEAQGFRCLYGQARVPKERLELDVLNDPRLF